MKANELRKVPEPLEQMAGSEFEMLVRDIESKFNKDHDHYDIRISVHKELGTVIVKNDTERKQMVRALSINFLEKGFDILYSTYEMANKKFTNLRIKWN